MPQVRTNVVNVNILDIETMTTTVGKAALNVAAVSNTTNGDALWTKGNICAVFTNIHATSTPNASDINVSGVVDIAVAVATNITRAPAMIEIDAHTVRPVRVTRTTPNLLAVHPKLRDRIHDLGPDLELDQNTVAGTEATRPLQPEISLSPPNT